MFADLVRRSGKPAILVANKCEGRAGEAGALEFYALGLGEPVAISAEHGEGLAGLYEALRAALPEATAAPVGEGRSKRHQGRKPDPSCGRRAPEHRKVDADQPPARRGTDVDRPRGGNHARRDRR